MQLHETVMGRRLIEGTLPDIANQLERIANALEKKQNQPDEEIEKFAIEFAKFYHSNIINKSDKELFEDFINGSI